MLILMAIAVIATALVGFVIYANTDVENLLTVKLQNNIECCKSLKVCNTFILFYVKEI